MGQNRQVREVDGSLSPYRERKVAEAIHQALRESGADDRALADELAGVVSLFLERAHPEEERPPAVSDVADAIERVLSECGHEEAARRFDRVRRQRARLRDELVVRSAPARSADAIVLPDEVGGDVAIARWSRSRLVASLTGRRELPGPLAEEVAAAVEQKVFGLGLRTVASALIRELVECELFERGVPGSEPGRAGARDQASLSTMLFDAAGDPPSVDECVTRPALAHFALSELHGPAVARAHEEGAIHVHHLGNPLALERLALPAELVPGGRGFALALRRVLDALRPHVAGTIEVSGSVPRLLAASGGGAAAADELADAALAADAFGGLTGPGIELEVPLAAAGVAPSELRAFAERLVERLPARAPGALRLRFALAPGADAFPGMAELALALLRADPTSCLDLADSAAGRGAGTPRLGISVARVTLNLPLLLLRARGAGLKDGLEGLDRGARLALLAFHERAWAHRRAAASGLAATAAVLGEGRALRVPAAVQEVDVEPWGLSHALELLVRRGVVPRPAIPEVAGRILGQLHYHAGEERDGQRFHPRTGGCTDRAVRRRMLVACEQQARALGVADVLAELKCGRAAEGVLPLAIPFADRRNRALLRSVALERTGPGLGIPEACFPGGLRPDLLPEISAMSNLGALRLAPAGAVGELEVQEELFA
jgi:hypothetical protein